MRSQRVLTLLIALLFLFVQAGVGGATPPGGLQQSGPGGAMPSMPEATSPAMSAGEDGASATQATIHLSPQQRQMIGVTSAVVEQTPLRKTIRTVGRVDFDERRLTDVTLKVSGWVQDLFVDYTGKPVFQKGTATLIR